MLTAWHSREESILALPDYEEATELAALRELTRTGKIVCPVCREPLWLRVGEKRCAHFAHRVLADCPHAHVSVAIIETRRLLYRFFQDRIQSGKLTGPIELEPAVAGLPDGIRVDLILRRDPKPPVAIVLLETGMKPELRWGLRTAVERQGFILRVAFLSSTLKQKEEAHGVFLLSTTQRDLKHKSPFGLKEDAWGSRDSLHFVDHERAHWTTLRSLHLDHPPQVYKAESVRTTPMSELLWSESQAEWTYPGEPRAKKAPPAPQPITFTPQPRPRESNPFWDAKPKPPPSFEPLAWMTAGLVCKGCQVRTNDWQTATPGEDSCVCRTCFAKGIR